ncbi:BspA family leucine-rich repeat surface protein [Mycoplasma mycoides subsp. capri]|uniref:BspA family leucine-rich repeat surface protein n=1 Tax=Mycoplasma mycoides TaxID=2102 RepID=UPI002240C613|nr:BspA family leucine-rich repeat surface protein [Mycoplasma mycoides]UZK64454.1 BspA family leucine-rich repeat surface protein [Mycoplasma mycoides subsp. capri]
MKKLLTILTSISSVFLIFAGPFLVTNSNKDISVNYNAVTYIKDHKIEGSKLVDIGYYKWGNKYRIKQIPTTVTVIAAELPKEITSLRSAFVGSRNNIIWEKTWDTKNITDMNSMFYNREDFDSSEIEKWDTSNVVDMGEMFYGAKNFNKNLSNWDVSNVQNMEKMFANATNFNNGGKPLDWGVKLKKVNNMKEMFKGNSSFKHNLNSWLMQTKVNNTNFGLDKSLEPKWFVEKPAPILSKPPVEKPNSQVISPRSDETYDTPSNANPTSPTIRSSDAPTTSTEDEETLKKPEFLENEKIEENANIKNNSDKFEDEIYKIPIAKPNTIIKSNSPSAGVITGTVLGTFTVLGIVGGTGYYYRKNLKNFYLNSANKTKNLYFKSKEKIKDKLSKIKSKK